MDTLALLDHSRDTGETVIVNLADLINVLSGSCDGGLNDKDASSPWWLPNIVGQKISDFQVGYLIDSLLTYGFVTPINIAWNYSNFLDRYCTGNGNHRLSAALFCGFTEIPVVVSRTYLNFDQTQSSEHDYQYPAVNEYNDAVCEHTWEIRETCEQIIREAKLTNPLIDGKL